MDNLTFEKNDNERTLETFEWDNPWWEHTENKDAKRILYIGDSISRGTLFPINKLADGKYLIDNFSTSKALDNPYFKASIEIFMSQQQRCDIIVFNNGLHGWHLSSEDYETGYKKMLDFLCSKDKPVYVLLSTHLPNDEERDKIVVERNNIASALADEYGLKIIDIYSVTKNKCLNYYCNDSVHLHEEGYIEIAKEILKTIE